MTNLNCQVRTSLSQHGTLQKRWSDAQSDGRLIDRMCPVA
jgi:hypothetical protein